MRGLALVFTLHVGRAPAAGDGWLSADKAKHFLMSAFVESASFSAIRATGASRKSSLVVATVVAGAVGVGKEVYDQRTKGDPSAKDLAWDAAGMAFAAALLHHTQR